MTEVQEGITQQMQRDQEIHQKITALLSRPEVKTHAYEKSTLYLVGDSILKELVFLESQVRGFSDPDKKRNPFDHYAKLINPHCPAYKYTHSVKPKYKLLTSEEKVRAAIPEHVAIWERTERKRLNEYLSQSELEESEANKMRRELEEKISLSKHNAEMLLKEFGFYDVVITNYEEGYTYSNLYYTTTDGESHNEHLRTTVPNILWYQEDIKRAKGRSNSKIERIVREYGEVCGQIYFKRKDEQ